MEKSQLVYMVEDSFYCPEGEGKIIRDYLRGVYSRVSEKLLSLGKSVDWLVIQSSDLVGVIMIQEL